MTDKTTDPSSPIETSVPATEAGLSRRRLVRAGLAAAPVMAALKSNSVLAGTGGNCIRPSTFSSIALTKLKGGTMSRNPQGDTNAVCKSPAEWQLQMPAGYANVWFLANGSGGNGNGNGGNGNGNGNNGAGNDAIRTPFTRNPGGDLQGLYESLKLSEALSSNASDVEAELARYVAAAFLSLKMGGGWLTEGEMAAIWNNRGVWTTGNGENWLLDKTLAFFRTVYSPGSF